MKGQILMYIKKTHQSIQSNSSYFRNNIKLYWKLLRNYHLKYEMAGTCISVAGMYILAALKSEWERIWVECVLSSALECHLTILQH